MESFEGILLIDKPSGCTSHDVVDRVRRILKMRAVGHAGTLDPLATGLMIILVGKATKVSQYLMSSDKEYEGTFLLGKETNTQDSEGEVVMEGLVPELGESEVKEYMKKFLGDQYQVPPMFSAKKVNGVPLYKMARKGQEIEREPRFIRVSKFEMLGWRSEEKECDFVLRCSKGTYVRTICHDIGRLIGCGAHMTALRRTMSGNFGIDRALTLDELGSIGVGDMKKVIIPTAQAVPTIAM